MSAQLSRDNKRRHFQAMTTQMEELVAAKEALEGKVRLLEEQLKQQQVCNNDHACCKHETNSESTQSILMSPRSSNGNAL